MDLRAPFVADPALVLAEPEHAGHGCDPQPLDRLARKQLRRDLHGGDPARRDAEAVGAGDALALQERVGGERGVGRARPDQPPAGKARELLGPVEHGIDGEPAAGDAVLVARIGGAEVGGAQEHGHVLGEVAVEMQAPAGEAQIVGQGRVEPGRAVVEQAGVVLDRPRLAIVHDEDAHGGPVVEAQMEELDAKGQVGVGPERVVGTEAQRLVLVPGQLGQLLRPLVAGGRERLAGEVARMGLEEVPVERLGGAEGRLGEELRGGGEHSGEEPPAGQGGGPLNQITALHAVRTIPGGSLRAQATTANAGGKPRAIHRSAIEPRQQPPDSGARAGSRCAGGRFPGRVRWPARRARPGRD